MYSPQVNPELFAKVEAFRNKNFGRFDLPRALTGVRRRPGNVYQ